LPTDFSVHIEAGRPVVRARGADVRRFDVMLTPRALGEHGDGEFHLEAYRLIAEQGQLLVNDVRALCDAVDKLRSSVLLARAGVPTPDAAVVQDPIIAAATLEAWRRAVAKPLYGSLGRGVHLLRAGAAPVRAFERLRRAQRALYLQAYVPTGGSDLRAF